MNLQQQLIPNGDFRGMQVIVFVSWFRQEGYRRRFPILHRAIATFLGYHSLKTAILKYQIN